MEDALKNMNITESWKLFDLNEKMEGSIIKTRAFISAIRITRSVTFITLRDNLDTIQCIALNSKSGEEDRMNLKKIQPECFVEVIGKINLVKTPVFGCTKTNIEIEISNINILGDVIASLPFSLKDAGATKSERIKNTGICSVAYNLRLDKRFLDFRLPSTQSIIRIIDGVMYHFRTFLRKNDFIEIKTTKIISSGSEGGSNLFSMNFFDRTAYLAQSPQLYKQMAIIGGLKRVYEIGHIYRAEQQNTNRYLSEFVGLDIEMEIEDSYIEIIEFIYEMFVNIFNGLKADYSRELEIIRQYHPFEDLKYHSKPLVITHREAVDLLIEQGHKMAYDDDFSKEMEKILGKIVKIKHDVDIFVVKDYPVESRAFYTYYDEVNKKTRSYDFIMRGEEILSGAQRITDYNKLFDSIKSKGINPTSLENYLEPFKFGPPPHGGCGIGMERVIKAYFGFDDIRYFSLFPRDASRIYP